MKAFKGGHCSILPLFIFKMKRPKVKYINPNLPGLQLTPHYVHFLTLFVWPSIKTAPLMSSF